MVLNPFHASQLRFDYTKEPEQCTKCSVPVLGYFSWLGLEPSAKESWVKKKFVEMTSAIQNASAIQNEMEEKFGSLSKKVFEMNARQARRMSDASLFGGSKTGKRIP